MNKPVVTGSQQEQKGGNGGEEQVTFLAYFPPIQTAIKVHGHMDGMRIQLDVPESEMGEALKLMLWRDKLLNITIRPVNDDNE